MDIMDWQEIQTEYSKSFGKDFAIKNWQGTGANIKCRTIQEWLVSQGTRYLTPDMDVRDIYLDYAWIAEGWRNQFGTPTLRDFVAPETYKETRKHVSSNIFVTTPWRVFAGNRSECGKIYSKTLEILDVLMRLVIAKYPRGANDRFVIGDSGCTPGKECPGHGGAHNNQDSLDWNYCTLTGFNMTHYPYNNAMPVQYANGFQNRFFSFWKDHKYPYKELDLKIFDSIKNYAFLEIVNRVFVDGNSLVSTGIESHFKNTYGTEFVHGDDIDYYNHDKHCHEYFFGERNWDTEMITI